uniref:E3 ubiquitin-protein ligase TRIM7-like n=1 Tax=Euleptes europaea TaxID=460621 RepID=UPI00253FC76D|nr:E3 ubiquitin-protein ligase TRIM7-like [Euleptes europaea]
MAAGSPVKELCEEATCSICLDYFRDPVILTECGHNFCRACLAQSWGESGAEASCPQCRGRAQEGNLRPNQQLANFVEIIQKLSPLEWKGAEVKGGEGKEGICEKHQEPLKFFCKDEEAPLCVVCGRSKEHKDHEVIPLEEASQENKIIAATRKERVCKKHQKPLKLFCKDDEDPICVVCDGSKEHKHHEILPLEEASQEYKDQFHSCLESLRKERENFLAYKADAVKKSQDLLKQTKGERQKTVTKFRQLHTFLEEQEKLLLAQMEEVEKEVVRKRDQHLAELSEVLSSLENLIWEMEEKCQQPASELLQDVRSTLQRYEEKETFENPLTFPRALKWRIWDFGDLNLLLEVVMKQFKDTLESGVHLQKAKNVTLDLGTANRKIVLSQDWKSIRWEDKVQDLPDSPERFDKYGAVLGREGFTAGRHFWEVLVGSEEEWAVGVARKSVRRKGEVIFSPEEGIWAVGKWGGYYRIARKPNYCPLSLIGELQRIRVCLNCEGGQVAFLDADTATPLCTFSETSFSEEALLPLFWVRLKGRLELSS